MNCPSYTSLSLAEQRDFIGNLIIAVQNDEHAFAAGMCAVGFAGGNGVFELTRQAIDKLALSDLDNKIENGPGGHTHRSEIMQEMINEGGYL